MRAASAASFCCSRGTRAFLRPAGGASGQPCSCQRPGVASLDPSLRNNVKSLTSVALRAEEGWRFSSTTSQSRFCRLAVPLSPGLAACLSASAWPAFGKPGSEVELESCRVSPVFWRAPGFLQPVDLNLLRRASFSRAKRQAFWLFSG